MKNQVSFAEAVYAHFYRRRKCEAEAHRTRIERARIVSIGNLTTGGTGKTPATAWLVRRLQNAGIPTVIVGRGYGGEYSAMGAVVSDGQSILLNSTQAGDEALLHARSLPGIPVVIGRDRVAAVQMAVERFAPQVIVLDDGFQYWSLARDFDLVLLDAKRPFGNSKLLPLGRLREPKSELRRAHALLLTRADAANTGELEQTRQEIAKLTDVPVFASRHFACGLRYETSGEVQTLEALQGQKIAAMSALAGNESFFQSLQKHGGELVCTLPRRDHHHWREKEVRDFATKARQAGAGMIVTTEKDAVKIQPEWCAPLPLFSLQIQLQFMDSQAEDDLWQLIRDRLI